MTNKHNAVNGLIDEAHEQDRPTSVEELCVRLGVSFATLSEGSRRDLRDALLFSARDLSVCDHCSGEGSFGPYSYDDERGEEFGHECGACGGRGERARAVAVFMTLAEVAAVEGESDDVAAE